MKLVMKQHSQGTSSMMAQHSRVKPVWDRAQGRLLRAQPALAIERCTLVELSSALVLRWAASAHLRALLATVVLILPSLRQSFAQKETTFSSVAAKLMSTAKAPGLSARVIAVTRYSR